MKGEDARVIVSRQYKKNGGILGESEDTETLSVPAMDPDAAVASVHFSGSMTLNLFNYESAKVTVGVTLPCYVEELDDAYTTAVAWVEERVTKEIEDIKAHREARKAGHVDDK